MKFNNAFLTKAGNVGMQFNTNPHRLLTVYQDQKGSIVFSEDATEKEKAELAIQFIRRKKWYKK